MARLTLLNLHYLTRTGVSGAPRATTAQKALTNPQNAYQVPSTQKKAKKKKSLVSCVLQELSRINGAWKAANRAASSLTRAKVWIFASAWATIVPIRQRMLHADARVASTTSMKTSNPKEMSAISQTASHSSLKTVDSMAMLVPDSLMVPAHHWTTAQRLALENQAGGLQFLVSAPASRASQ